MDGQVAEALKTCSKLKVLDLGGNNFREEGMAVLASALKGCSSLTTSELG